MITAETIDPQPLPSLVQILQNNPGWLDEPLPTEEAAEFMNQSPATLESKRTRGGGPKYAKDGRLVFYTRRWLLEHLWRGRRHNTSEAA